MQTKLFRERICQNCKTVVPIDPVCPDCGNVFFLFRYILKKVEKQSFYKRKFYGKLYY